MKISLGVKKKEVVVVMEEKNIIIQQLLKSYFADVRFKLIKCWPTRAQSLETLFLEMQPDVLETDDAQ